jgi:hypothetical protein
MGHENLCPFVLIHQGENLRVPEIRSTSKQIPVDVGSAFSYGKYRDPGLVGYIVGYPDTVHEKHVGRDPEVDQLLNSAVFSSPKRHGMVPPQAEVHVLLQALESVGITTPIIPAGTRRRDTHLLQLSQAENCSVLPHERDVRRVGEVEEAGNDGPNIRDLLCVSLVQWYLLQTQRPKRLPARSERSECDVSEAVGPGTNLLFAPNARDTPQMDRWSY